MTRFATLVAALIVAACGAALPAATPAPTVEKTVPPVSIPPGAVVIELDIPPNNVSEFHQNGVLVTELHVLAGKPYVIRVNNPSNFDHNFYIGGAKDLAAREYGRLVGIKLWSNGTRELVHTFKAGELIQFACTLAGHYGNMHADIVVDQ